ncbi:hypothetical protein ASN18_2383 [Candidatus Magnetominusculus xianensis]|uniref:Uncharacterized protein n=1 Tax=Candidatus Magnetominusculus xianensis TaxID=1748249 RepID=A0ABR5SD69_9BACT|nr:hypothetical protein ASN18_2383 [Candidatus Magnetominusculus xianensis]
MGYISAENVVFMRVSSSKSSKTIDTRPLIINPVGHFYFGKNRTFLFWLDMFKSHVDITVGIILPFLGAPVLELDIGLITDYLGVRLYEKISGTNALSRCSYSIGGDGLWRSW